MRSRKPWTLARRRLFGWNVRLLTRAPQSRDSLLIEMRHLTVSLLTVRAMTALVKLSCPSRRRHSGGKAGSEPDSSAACLAPAFVEHFRFPNVFRLGDLGCGKLRPADRLLARQRLPN